MSFFAGEDLAVYLNSVYDYLCYNTIYGSECPTKF